MLFCTPAGVPTVLIILYMSQRSPAVNSSAIRLRMMAERHGNGRPAVPRCAACSTGSKVNVIVRRPGRLHVQCSGCLHVWCVSVPAGQA